MKIGFIGLGMMGDPMAQCLLKADHKLTVFDVNTSATKQCAELGAIVAGSVADLTSQNIVFIIVNSGSQVNEVLFGDNGLITCSEGNQPQTIVIMSTISPNLIREFNSRIKNNHITLLDAPVSGGPIIAQMGQLSIMIGGDPEKIEAVKPYFEVMGKDIFLIGSLGSGLAIKLINNIVALNNAYVFTEALSIGVEANLDINKIIEVMSASSGKNWCTDNWDIYKMFTTVVLNDPSFHQTAEKDIETAIEWSKEMKFEIPALPNVLSIIKSFPGVSEKLVDKLS